MAAFTNEEEVLFTTIGETVLKRLRKTRNPADLLSVLRSEQKQFERAYLKAPAAALESVACRAGCDACCHVPVGVQAHEVLIVAEHIQKTFSPEELEAVITRAATYRTTVSGKTNRAQAALKLPCVLLRTGNCTVYEARPEACRSHHSHNAAACGQNLDFSREEIDVYVPGVRGRMFAVMLGIDQAVAEAGYDGQAYDFGSALYEALTDSFCAVRWTQRQRAFSDESREEGSENSDGVSGVIQAEGFFQ